MMKKSNRRQQAELVLDFWNHGPREAAASSLELMLHDEYERGRRAGVIQGFLGAALPVLGSLVWLAVR